jgi:hypothetical protein
MSGGWDLAFATALVLMAGGISLSGMVLQCTSSRGQTGILESRIRRVVGEWTAARAANQLRDAGGVGVRAAVGRVRAYRRAAEAACGAPVWVFLAFSPTACGNDGGSRTGQAASEGVT